MLNALHKFIRNIFSYSQTGPPDMQDAFRNHYLSFRSLLTANNNALELMAEMEQALDSGQPFSMAFVRGHCTAVTVNIYKMVQNLNELSNGKYKKLEQAFNDISAQLEEILARQPQIPQGSLLLPLSEISSSDADLVGDKMANLGEVRNRAGLNVPDGFVITATATHHFMQANNLQDEINRLLKTLDHDNLEELYTISASIQQLISKASLPEDLEHLIKEHYRGLSQTDGQDILVSLRSSAVGEDRSNVSFAGQYRTQLNVSEEFLGQTYKEIVASKYKSQAIVYRLQRGFRHQDVIMCVGCLVMVDAAVSGVMFSRSPQDLQSPWVEINAAYGLAVQVVDGRVKTDFYKVSREEGHAIISKGLPEGKPPVLTDEQAGQLALTAIHLEKHFGVPQDIEWSIDRSGKIIILQSRPLGQSAIIQKTGDEETVPDDVEGVLLSGGLTACRGTACGPVHIVHTNVDLLEFPKGAVLVVAYPLPEWASLLNRAAAVISETGHTATHLAIVAREFGVPSVFGLNNATKQLTNGTIITVDASNRCIYSGRNEEVLARTEQQPNLMADSPLYNLLKEALSIILPLNLLDPDSPFFKPAYCKTFHDLTRFCHEKSVTEMFAFGSRQGFDEKSAKQLVGETNYKWWIINLDDGFRPEYDIREHFIRTEDIVSSPMLAIWEGMTALPWQGPPPVSLGGFGAILFRSTMNPSLDPAVRSSMAAKNYFLISRNFCNLSMRLGYHFTMAEAYLGSLLTENYVSFKFKGGAADKERRFLRVQLIKDILEQFDFRVELKTDALSARIEKKPSEYLTERLRVLGYLLIHTRQIDMVMGDQAMVEHYRQKIMTDLKGLFNFKNM